MSGFGSDPRGRPDPRVAAIRRANSAEIHALPGIENAADQMLIDWLNAEQWSPAPTGESRLETPGFILVTGPGIGVGFVHVIVVHGLAHLEQLSVHPSNARRGNGTRLLEAAKAEAAKRGHKRLTLRTFSEVPWNAPFYARHGFAEEEPNSKFHRQLVETEERLGLDKLGERIQMGAT